MCPLAAWGTEGGGGGVLGAEIKKVVGAAH